MIQYKINILSDNSKIPKSENKNNIVSGYMELQKNFSMSLK